MGIKENKVKELIGVKEIARRANVSIATVDRVLHDRQGVSLATKEKIQAIIKELDYQPNVFARRLSTSKTLRIAALIPRSSVESAFWDAPLEGIRAAADEIRQFGAVVDVLLFDQNDREDFILQASVVENTAYDGVLIAPMFGIETKAFLDNCQQRNIPYVFVNSDIIDSLRISYFGPDLYQSGYMAAHLLKYMLREDEEILLLNISKEMDADHHLLKKEQGFRTYFVDHSISNNLRKLDIRDTTFSVIAKELDAVLDEYRRIKAIFVTNSRISSVAKYFSERVTEKPLLIGFDFLPENVLFLKQDIIDFLICQKPKEQGNRAIMALYNKLLFNIDGKILNHMPIDVVTKENYMFYED